VHVLILNSFIVIIILVTQSFITIYYNSLASTCYGCVIIHITLLIFIFFNYIHQITVSVLVVMAH
jgi:hypothetical protein